MKLIRYCHECGHVGDVPAGKRYCCPDGSHAVLVPKAVAEQARMGFEVTLLAYEARALARRYERVLRALA